MPLSPTTTQLEQFLTLTNKREQMIVRNMANVDTPGYRTLDLNFGSELKKAMAEPDQTNLHIAAHTVPGLLQRPDGNNVDLDRESLLLSEAQLQYQLGTQMLKSKFHQLLSAINGDK